MSPRYIATGEEVGPEDMPTDVYPALDPRSVLPPGFGAKARALGAQHRAHRVAVAKAFVCGLLSALTVVALVVAALY